MEEAILNWTQGVLAPSLQIPEDELENFVSKAFARIVMYYESKGLSPSEADLTEKSEELAGLAKMPEREFLALFAEEEGGGGDCSAGQCDCPGCSTKSKIHRYALIGLVLVVAWKLGKTSFYALLAMMGIYWVAKNKGGKDE